MARAAVGAFAEFLTREMAIVVLLFVVLYKFCDAFAGTMTAPFVIDLGFSRNDYAAIVKGVGLAATLIGGFAGGVVARALPLVTCLWIGALLQTVSNLVFSWLALVGTNHWALTATIIAENFTGAIGTVIFVAYLSALCKSPLHTATQFALLTALAAVGRTYLSSGAGFVAQSTGWPLFFVISALVAMPSFALLPGCRRAGISRRSASRRSLPGTTKTACAAGSPPTACLRRDNRARRRPARRARAASPSRSRRAAVGDVMRGGLAIDRGVEREDHLAHRRIVRARHQRVDRQSRGPMPSSGDSVPPST